jgi:hypothetical protein
LFAQRLGERLEASIGPEDGELANVLSAMRVVVRYHEESSEVWQALFEHLIEASCRPLRADVTAAAPYEAFAAKELPPCIYVISPAQASRRCWSAASSWETSIDFKGIFSGDSSLGGVNPDAEFPHKRGFFPRRSCNTRLRSRWSLRGDCSRFKGQIAEGTPGLPQQRSLKALVSLQCLGLEVDRHGHPLTVDHGDSAAASWCSVGR